LVDVQCVGLPTRPVEREHELSPESLAQRVQTNEPFELTDKRRMPASGEIHVDAPLQAGDAELVESGDLGLREALIGEVGERPPTPKTQRGLEVAVGDQLLDAIGVELAWSDPELVPQRSGEDPVLPECLAELGHVHLERLRRGSRWALAPERLQQHVLRHDAVRVQEEYGQKGAGLASAELDGSAIVANIERAENAELHCVATLTPPVYTS
jgi:hypothetical protein